MQPLPQRRRHARGLELIDQPGRHAEREAGVELLLEQRELQVLEATEFIACPAVVVEVGQRRPAPEVERSPSDVRSFAELACSSQLASVVQGRGRAPSVDVAGVDPEPVADVRCFYDFRGAAGLPHCRTQARHDGVQPLRMNLGDPLSPKRLHGPIARDGLPGLKREQCEKRALLWSTERGPSIAHPQLHRAK